MVERKLGTRDRNAPLSCGSVRARFPRRAPAPSTNRRPPQVDWLHAVPDARPPAPLCPLAPPRTMADTMRLLRTLKLHTKPVDAVCVTPDGKHVISASRDHTVCISRLEDGKLVHTLRHDKKVECVCTARDGCTVISGSWDCMVRVWALATGSLLRTLKMDSLVRTMRLAPNDEHLLVGTWCAATIWSVSTGRKLQTLARMGQGINACAFTPDGKLALVATEKTVRVHSVADGAVLSELSMTYTVYRMHMVDNQRVLLECGRTHASMVSFEGGSITEEFECDSKVLHACVTADSKHIVVMWYVGELRVHESSDGTFRGSFKVANDPMCTSLCTTSDDKHIIIGRYDDMDCTTVHGDHARAGGHQLVPGHHRCRARRRRRDRRREVRRWRHRGAREARVRACEISKVLPWVRVLVQVYYCSTYYGI